MEIFAKPKSGQQQQQHYTFFFMEQQQHYTVKQFVFHHYKLRYGETDVFLAAILTRLIMHTCHLSYSISLNILLTLRNVLRWFWAPPASYKYFELFRRQKTQQTIEKKSNVQDSEPV